MLLLRLLDDGGTEEDHQLIVKAKFHNCKNYVTTSSVSQKQQHNVDS
jgi:hypothetical protein